MVRIELLHKGKPVTPGKQSAIQPQYRIGLWDDKGTAYGTNGLLRALGLSDTIELISRESSNPFDIAKHPNILEVKPLWLDLRDALVRTKRMVMDLTERNPNVLVARLAEASGVYADHPIKDGIDALGLYDEYPECDINKKGHFLRGTPDCKVVALVRGVRIFKNMVIAPCVYVLYEGDLKPHLDALDKCIETCQIALDSGSYQEYTLRMTTTINGKQN